MADEEKSIEYYQHRARCGNCRTILDFKIPKGMAINMYVETTGQVCHRCGLAIHNMVLVPYP